MRVLGLDFETTGIDTRTSRITEMGLVVWDVENKLPLKQQSYFLYDGTYPEIHTEELNGISLKVLQEFGISPAFALAQIRELIEQHSCSYVVAHNGRTFDRPILAEECMRAGHLDYIPTCKWIDTMYDLPWYGPSKKLGYLAADHGFLNPFPHRALTDVLTMLTIMSKYSFDKVVKKMGTPTVMVKALVTKDMRHLAKEHQFRWQECGGKFYGLSWIKEMKLDDYEAAKFPFQATILEQYE